MVTIYNGKVLLMAYTTIFIYTTDAGISSYMKKNTANGVIVILRRHTKNGRRRMREETKRILLYEEHELHLTAYIVYMNVSILYATSLYNTNVNSASQRSEYRMPLEIRRVLLLKVKT